LAAISDQDFDYVRDLVYRHSAIALESDKGYLVESRLLPIVRDEGLGTLGDLVGRLRAGRGQSLHLKVVDAMTTNETSFFRDMHPFEALKTRIFPDLLARARPSRLRLWCAACSSGQEPYSIAMLLREHFPALPEGTVQIIATDLSPSMLARARRGRYSQLEVNRGLPASLLMKYFDKLGLEWEIKPEIRAMVSFREHNLAESWGPMPVMDVVFLRNVLIYFDVATKQAILSKVRGLLREDGYLFLGASETTINLDRGFARLCIGKATCYRNLGH
jgi:chemotaxis protein methyltransferase CheR